ncbi:hypothetical protein ES705_41469 [subsurface metagenome]
MSKKKEIWKPKPFVRLTEIDDFDGKGHSATMIDKPPNDKEVVTLEMCIEEFRKMDKPCSNELNDVLNALLKWDITNRKKHLQSVCVFSFVSFKKKDCKWLGGGKGWKWEPIEQCGAISGAPIFRTAVANNIYEENKLLLKEGK